MKTILIALLLTTSGCATMDHGTTQAISVNSYPSGATIKFDNGRGKQVNFETPAVLVLSRKLPYILKITKEGYTPKAITLTSSSAGNLWNNLIWIHPVGIFAGYVVDSSTGASKKLSPDNINVTLEQIK